MGNQVATLVNFTSEKKYRAGTTFLPVTSTANPFFLIRLYLFSNKSPTTDLSAPIRPTIAVGVNSQLVGFSQYTGLKLNSGQ